MKTRKTIAVLAGASLLVFGAAFMAHAGWRTMGEGRAVPVLAREPATRWCLRTSI